MQVLSLMARQSALQLLWWLFRVPWKRNNVTTIIEKAVSKIISARVFEDENGKMNLNIQQVKGAILMISQFTWVGAAIKVIAQALIALCHLPRRRAFSNILHETRSACLYPNWNIGASMEVNLTNLVPVIFIFEFLSDMLFFGFIQVLIRARIMGTSAWPSPFNSIWNHFNSWPLKLVAK